MSDVQASYIGRINRGLFPAVPVTFRQDGSIDFDAHQAYIAWMTQQPVRGVAVWAHTGRGLFLGADDRARVMRQWTEAADGKLVVAGVGAVADDGLPADRRAQQYQDDSLRMAEHALECGAQVLMMYAPVLYRGRDDQDARIIEHVKALAGLGAPLLLFYLYEAAGGISYSLEVLREMFALPEVIGIKMATLDSVMTVQDVATLIKDEFGHQVLVTGEDRFLGYSLMTGATAALIGMAAACTAPQAQLLQYWFDGHCTDFVQLNAQVDGFAQATFRAPMEGYIQRLLWCLVDEGIVPADSSFDPYGPPLPAAERDLVHRRARALLGAV
ncbi:MAG: dihydrodipicolinate synthase family protein [Armatimonadetes bacterium]|nr:dihydrodipicolinate synthase family protein [Armatimonadota bacterium]